MNPAESIEGLSIAQKVQMMEVLWDDRCRSGETPPAPAWHEEVLNEREERIKRGDGVFMDWNDAKKHIRDVTS